MIRPQHRHPFAPARNARVATALVVAACLGCSLFASTSSAPLTWPSLPDLSATLRAALPSLPSPEGSYTNAEAYARSLSPWVLTGSDSEDREPKSPILKTHLYPGGSGYLRIGSVAPALHDALLAALDDLRKDGPLSGLVLDLRFADGPDLGAGIDAASALASNGPVEFRLGDVTWETRRAANPPTMPILVLVNRQTRQAAEALATAVRSVATKALVLGSPTAGQARSYRPLPVSDALTVQVAQEALRLPDGSEFPASGLKPDLVLTVSEADERAYAMDEYQRVRQGRPVVSEGAFRLNEAELVRRRRQPRSLFEEPHAPGGRRRTDGEDGDGGAFGAPAAVQDPALGLALDLISGAALDAAEATTVTASGGVSR